MDGATSSSTRNGLCATPRHPVAPPAELYVLDQYGRYVPAPNRFPSAAHGAGFKPLADYVHSLGLKFGIHILRGIPREAVARNLPIAGTRYTAAEAADIHSTCPWNPDNYGVDLRRPAGQAYYDSIAHLYASWGVDLVKADCIASHPYAGEEIRMLSGALAASGRDMVLSLSPGPAPVDKTRCAAALLNHVAHLQRRLGPVAQHGAVPTGRERPVRARRALGAARRARSLARCGHAGGGLSRPCAGLGEAAASRLTHAEQRTYLTLWCIARSPLFMGGNLSRADRWTEDLLANPEVIAVDQHSSDAHQAFAHDGFVVWLSQPDAGGGWYLAAFNTRPRGRTLTLSWQALELPQARYGLRDLWQHRDLGTARTIEHPTRRPWGGAVSAAAALVSTNRHATARWLPPTRGAQSRCHRSERP